MKTQVFFSGALSGIADRIYDFTLLDLSGKD